MQVDPGKLLCLVHGLHLQVNLLDGVVPIIEPWPWYPLCQLWHIARHREGAELNLGGRMSVEMET